MGYLASAAVILLREKGTGMDYAIIVVLGEHASYGVFRRVDLYHCVTFIIELSQHWN